MTDYRAELQRLVKAYDEHGGRWPDHHEQALSDAVEAARTTLAQPEPEGVGVTDFEEELMAAWDKAILLPRTGRLAEYRAWLAHVLALVWAVGRRPTTKPVSVSERPWEREGWCNSDNEAFFFNSDTKKWSLYKCDEYSPVMTNASDRYTHSLPHHALPVPGAEVG